jgi:hypothetical protein
MFEVGLKQIGTEVAMTHIDTRMTQFCDENRACRAHFGCQNSTSR